MWNFEILKLLWNFYWPFLSQIKTKIAHWNSSTSLILLYVIFTGQHFWNWKNLQSRVTYRFFISLVFLFWTLIYKVNFQVAVFIYPQSTLHVLDQALLCMFGSSAFVHVYHLLSFLIFFGSTILSALDLQSKLQKLRFLPFLTTILPVTILVGALRKVLINSSNCAKNARTAFWKLDFKRPVKVCFSICCKDYIQF